MELVEPMSHHFSYFKWTVQTLCWSKTKVAINFEALLLPIVIHSSAVTVRDGSRPLERGVNWTALSYLVGLDVTAC